MRKVEYIVAYGWNTEQKQQQTCPNLHTQILCGTTELGSEVHKYLFGNKHVFIIKLTVEKRYKSAGLDTSQILIKDCQLTQSNRFQYDVQDSYPNPTSHNESRVSYYVAEFLEQGHSLKSTFFLNIKRQTQST